MNASQIALGLFIYTVLIVSALISLLLFLVEEVNGDFFDVALPAKAKVTHIEEQSYGDHDVMVTVTYWPEKRGRMTGTLNDGSSTDFVIGQDITVLYDPDEPSEVKAAKESEYAELVSKIKVGAIFIFLITLGWVIYSTKSNDKKPEERIRN